MDMIIKFRIFELAYNHSQSIEEKLYFSCEIVHYGKSSISIFQEIFANV